MKRHHIALGALASYLAVGMLASCGGDGDSDGSGGESAGSAGAGKSGSGGVSGGGGGSAGEAGDAGSSGNGGTAGDGALPPVCEAIATLCDPVARPSGAARDCSDLAHAGDADICDTELEACRDACEEQTPIDVAIEFEARVGSEPFDCAGTYAGLGADDSTVHPVDLRFYVHAVRLIDTVGDETPIALTQDGVWQHEGVALLDFENRSGTCANGTPDTNRTLVGTVPPGDYTGLVFKIGVPFELNHTDIATAPSPLNLSSLFWGWSMGRIFLSIMNSTELDSGNRFGTLLHLGSMGCTGNPAAEGVQSCAKPNRGEYRFPDFQLGTSRVVADVRGALERANLKTDLCHSFEPACAGPIESLGIDWETGEPTETQSFLSVE